MKKKNLLTMMACGIAIAFTGCSTYESEPEGITPPSATINI